jgi:sterol desaturase/sphingolipid hydroxylase (fatty acid hydroxylase superfamily)
MFTYHVLRFTVLSPAIVWRAADATLGNTLGALGALFVFYDFFYCLFHRGLHRPEVYRFVHKVRRQCCCCCFVWLAGCGGATPAPPPWKLPRSHTAAPLQHHHKQFAPSRGNTDALNVHPFEFISGEYLHLFSLAAVGSVLNVHVWTVACFIIAGGVLASLNHTRCAPGRAGWGGGAVCLCFCVCVRACLRARYDVSLPSHSHWVFSVALHDVHHSVGQNKNFSQYHPLWDKIFGSFQAWAPPLAGKQK